jgi:raffinose/stachyose/melibiose transport system substrate-binding protein
LKDLAKSFMDANPGTEIVTESVAGDAFAQKLDIAMATGSMNDITAVSGAKVTKDTLADYFLPIDDLGFTKDNLLFYEDGVGSDGKLYKMTSAVTYWAMVYNKKVFADCGITAVPKTIDELYAACEKIKAKNITPIATNYKDAWPLIPLSQFNAEAVKGAGYYNSLAAGDEIITADGIGAQFKTWLDLKNKGYLDKDLVSASWDQTQKDLAQGKVAMTCLGSFAPKMFADQGADINDIGMFPWVGAPGAYVGSDWFFAIAKNTKNPELAKAYFKYMWEEGRYAGAVGAVAPVLGVKSTIPAVDELLSYGLPVQAPATSDDMNAITNKGQIQIHSALQEYLVSDKPEDIIMKYNQKFSDAKKALDK